MHTWTVKYTCNYDKMPVLVSIYVNTGSYVLCKHKQMRKKLDVRQHTGSVYSIWKSQAASEHFVLIVDVLEEI